MKKHATKVIFFHQFLIINSFLFGYLTIIIKLFITTKMAYRTQPTPPKPKSSFDKQRTESQWIEDRIPPLISINPTR